MIRPDVRNSSVADNHRLAGDWRCTGAINDQCLGQRNDRGVFHNVAGYILRVARTNKRKKATCDSRRYV